MNLWTDKLVLLSASITTPLAIINFTVISISNFKYIKKEKMEGENQSFPIEIAISIVSVYISFLLIGFNIKWFVVGVLAVNLSIDIYLIKNPAILVNHGTNN